MTKFGMPGVFAHGTFDTWSPGYLMFIAATHNGISRLYETFGNGGTAETMERTLSPAETERSWFKQNPPLPRVRWSLRNNNNYQQTGLLVSLSYVANNKLQLLRNFYEKSKRSVEKPRVEGPAAYILTADDPRPGAQAELLRIMQKQAVEISRATAPFSVTIPAKRNTTVAANGAAGGRGGRGGANANAAGGPEQAGTATADPQPTVRSFPAGTYIIRMDQPYSRIADALLDVQFWSPNDPQRNPYDDTGWTFPEQFGVQILRATDVKVLDVPVEKVTGKVQAPGGVTGTGSVFAINHNGDNGLATLRYKFKDADFQVAEEPFEASGQKFNRGSFIVRNVAQAELDRESKNVGVKIVALASAPTVKTHPARAARVAIMHTWQNTQTEGWWREAFDFNQIPFDYISTQEASKDANLNAKYDVIIFGPGGGNGRSIIDGLPMWRNPIPWKNTPETPNIGTWAQTDDMRPGLGWTGLQNLEAFVRRGGVLITADNTAEFAIDFGITDGVSTATAASGVVDGSILRSKIVDDASPIVYGVKDSLALYTAGGRSFSVSNNAGGRGGAGGGGGGAAGGGRGGGNNRATGRGAPDEQDIVPGRPALDPRFERPVPETGTPWKPVLPTEEQLRNPLNIIPPDQRPRVALRWADQRDLFVSGLLNGGGDIAQRPVVVDAPVEKGHVVMFANNPMWRGETIGAYFLVFNTILNWDNLNAGRKLDAR